MSELYPGSWQVDPMKYGNKPVDDKVESAMHSSNWILQRKYDGAWYQLEKINDETIYLFGRTLSRVTGEYTEKIANVPWLKEWAKYLPDGTVLIGEICIPGGHSNDVTKIMGCLPEKAIERQKATDVQYRVFDCIRYDGTDLCSEGFDIRFGFYVKYMLVDMWNDKVKPVDTWSLDGSIGELAESYEEILSSIFKSGGEGAVVKHKDCPYRAGKRTTASQMFKIKEHVDSVDLVCMELLDPEMRYTGKELDSWPYWVTIDMFAGGNYEGFPRYLIIGDGKEPPLDFLDWYRKKYPEPEHPIPVTKHYYYGWKNAMRVGAYDEKGNLKEVGRVASGFTDELREDMATNPNNYIGRCVQLSCMSLNKKDMTIRHPVFEKMRDDKDAKDCILKEIFS